MTPETTIAQLVQAFLFQLLDEDGDVRGEWGETLDVFGSPAFGMRFVLPALPGPPAWPEDNTAGLRWGDDGANGRVVYLDGPEDFNGGSDRPGVALSSSSVAATTVFSILYAGDLAEMVGGTPGDDVAGVLVQRFGAAGAYVTAARLRAGDTEIVLIDSTAGTPGATLQLGAAGAAEPIAQSPAPAALTAAVNYGLAAGLVSETVRSGEMVGVTGRVTNTSGGALAIPQTLATIPAGFLPAATVGCTGYSSLGASRYTISVAGSVVMQAPAGNIPAGGFAEFNAVYPRA